MNDGFLPDRAPLGIIHVVALIKHHRLNIGQRIITFIRFGIEHVAEDLSGHHHDRGLSIHTQITGHQTDVLVTELLSEISQLLIGEGLQRSCVEDLLTMGQGAIDGVFAHQRLARTRGSADNNGMPVIQCCDGIQLKVIQRKWKDRSRIKAGRCCF